MKDERNDKLLISRILLDKRGMYGKFFSTRSVALFGNEEDFIVVTSSGDGGAPNGISGAPLLLESEWLLFEKDGITCEFTKLRYQDFEIWDPKIRKIMNFKDLTGIIGMEAVLDGLASKVDGRILNRIETIVEGESWENLVGFGPGLTPLGDDVISGMLALSVLEEEETEKLLKISNSKTNSISRKQMNYAAIQLVPKAVKEFLEEGKIDNLMKMGNTSGLGWMLGIVKGLECLEG